MNNNPFKGKSIFDIGLEVEEENNQEEDVVEETLDEVEEETNDSNEILDDPNQDYENEIDEEQDEPLEEDAPKEDTEEVSAPKEENPFKGRSIFSLDEEFGEETSDDALDETEEQDEAEETEAEALEEPVEEVASEGEEEAEALDDIPEPKFVLITGAYGGLGRAAMEEVLKLGYAVFALDLDIDEDYINDNVMPIQCDLTNERSIYQAYATISEYTENLYAIINCAGVFYFDTMVEGSEAKLKKIFDINFFGTYRINQLFLPFLQKGCKIINVTSEVSGYSPQPFMGCYTISKKMVDCYSDVLRRELNYVGIKVIKIQAGSFRTGLFNKVNIEFERMYNSTEVYKKQLQKLKFMMDRELHKQHNPYVFGRVIRRILKRRNPKICYRINRSRSLRFLNSLPEKWQDRIYKRVIK